MTNLNGENSSEMSSNEKENPQEEETPVVEPIVNLIQQLEEYTPTVIIVYFMARLLSVHIC